MSTAYDVSIVCPHIKMLAGDYLCYATLAHDNRSEPYCRLCSNFISLSALTKPPIEDIVHVLTGCKGTRDTRERIMPDLLNTVSDHFPRNRILENPSHEVVIIDCSSLNLDNDMRINHCHPDFTLITKQCSSFIYAIHSDRLRQLKRLGAIK